jgi:aminoglycoside N3'-acetyltransferase
MADRSSQEVRRELESERERLGKAVQTLRKRADAARRKLPILAVGAAGASLVLRTASRRVFGRKSSGTEKRARFSFLDRGD